ncbi:MAG: TonB-dependent receptor [Saprospiraceae bacterium]|nr:TonB-dependent receptor [Saprospiraceae bacterium]
MRISTIKFLGRYKLGMCLLIIGFLTLSPKLQAQVTTSSMVGRIIDDTKEPLIGATVVAVHTPSGTRYGTVTNEDGRFTIPSMRIGGPYQVTVSYTGYEDIVQDNIYLSLGTATNIDLTMHTETLIIEGVVVTSSRSDVFSSDRTGAATTITAEQLSTLPTTSRNFLDFTRLTPQARGSSIGGQDNRLNNITIDGSLLNNSFGLAGEPGGRTGIAPISLDAIEEVQVNIAPFDVRQSGFVGGGINAVTRSGTNEFSGSAFLTWRNQNLTGINAGETVLNRDQNQFTNKQFGFRLGGPIIKNKLFFFTSVELERRASPYQDIANKGNDAVEGNTTRVLESDLKSVSDFLKSNFGYETGDYQGYDLATTGNKYLAKLDWNINDRNKFSLRFNRLDSEADQLISNSSSLGFGNRRTNGRAMSFRNSNYIIFDKITSVIGELNTLFSNKMSNNFIAGWTFQNEDRGTYGEIFPLIEIQKEGQTYISTGFEPFTPDNQLQYTTYQLQDNLSLYLNKHTLTAGLSLERLQFRNVFFPGSQGVFVYNSLEDFYSDLSDAKANPNRTSSPVELRRFQYRYSALPGGAEPVQPTRVTYGGIYLQDEIAVTNQLMVSAGIRMDVPVFDDTGFENQQVLGQTYRDPEGNALKVSTKKLPDPQFLFSPRLGFNWDAMGDRSLQLRGGTGIFTGRPAFVWISNVVGNNGVLTGFEQIDRTTTRPFTTNPGSFITNAAAPSSYNIDLVNENFKFPQVWRSNLAVDKQLPGGFVGTLEMIFSKDINGISYWNINEEKSSSKFMGPDNRPTYPGLGLSGTALNEAIRLNDNVTGAVYLTNENKGTALNFTASLERRFSKGWFAKAAYNFGSAQNLVDAGSIASGSYNSIVSVNGNNFPELGYSSYDQRHRLFGAITYRFEYLKAGATQLGLFINGATQGRFSYVYNQDMNGDGINGNDLIYVPNNASELNFVEFASNGITFTSAQQAAAFDKYIDQDAYLSTRRGQYAERNGALLPWLWRADFSFLQEVYVNTGGKRNTLQFRADIINFTNLINKSWGISDKVINSRPLSFSGVTGEGQPSYKMVTTGSGTSTKLLDQTLQKDAIFGSDTYSIQFGIRYLFN